MFCDDRGLVIAAQMLHFRIQPDEGDSKDDLFYLPQFVRRMPDGAWLEDKTMDLSSMGQMLSKTSRQSLRERLIKEYGVGGLSSLK